MATEYHGPAVHMHFDLDETLAPTYAAFSTSWRENMVAEVRAHYPHMSLDEITTVYRTAYQSHGCSFSGLAEMLGKDRAWVDDAYLRHNLASLEHLGNLERLPRLPPLLEQLAQVSRVAVLTQSSGPYAVQVLHHMGIAPYVHMVRSRAYKRTPVPFQTILAEEGHHEAEHWLIEDSPANLPMAKRFGFTTVLVGNNPGEADHRFPTVEDFLDAYLADELAD